MGGQRIEELAERLIDGGEATAAFFETLTPQEWEIEVQGEGERWRARDVLAHFATIERSMQWLFSAMLQGDDNASSEFDLNRYNNSQVAKLRDASREELIERFRQTRSETVRLVKDMRGDDLDREGEHPFLGHGTLERFVRWATEHTAIHEQDILKVIRAKRG